MESLFSSMWNELVNEFGAETLTGLLVVYGIVLAAALLVGLVGYILYGIALLRMAKRAGVKNGWLGFIPLASDWLLGRLSDVGSARRHSGARILTCGLLTFLGSGVLTAWCLSLYATVVTNTIVVDETALMGHAFGILLFSLLTVAASICMLVFYCMALYRVAQNFGGANASIWALGLILSLFFFQLATFILLLILSGKTPMHTEGNVSVAAPAPQSGTSSDSVFQ